MHKLKKKISTSQLLLISFCGVLCIILGGSRLFAADKRLTIATNAPIDGQNAWHQNESLPDGVLAWDSLAKETNVVVDAGKANFNFSFTNISPSNVSILEIQPSCGCTTVQLPSLPWMIPAGAKGQFDITVNLIGKARKQAKSALVLTDRGFEEITLNVNILPPVIPKQSSADRALALAMAKADRQMIFHGDCMTCHVKPGEGKDGKALYYAICAICHESKGCSEKMPDLFAIKTPANVAFWLNWIAHGKSGSLMPAFSIEDGGPLSESQIAGIARYLNTTDHVDVP